MNKKGIFFTIITLFIMVNLLTLSSVYRDRQKNDLQDSNRIDQTVRASVLRGSLAWGSFYAIGGQSITTKKVNTNTQYIFSGHFHFNSSKADRFLDTMETMLDNHTAFNTTNTAQSDSNLDFRFTENVTVLSLGKSYVRLRLNKTNITGVVINMTTSGSSTLPSVVDNWVNNGAFNVQLNFLTSGSVDSISHAIALGTNQIPSAYTGTTFGITMRASRNSQYFDIEIIQNSNDWDDFAVTSVKVTYGNSKQPSVYIDNNFILRGPFGKVEKLYLIR